MLNVAPFSTEPVAAVPPAPEVAVAADAVVALPAGVVAFPAEVVAVPAGVVAVVDDLVLELLPQAAKASSDPVIPSALKTRWEVLFT